jgi:hypothetical protein
VNNGLHLLLLLLLLLLFFLLLLLLLGSGGSLLDLLELNVLKGRREGGKEEDCVFGSVNHFLITYINKINIIKD